MVTKPKIRIIDNIDLRNDIDEFCGQTSQINLTKWAINCVKHILPLADFEGIDFTTITFGFKTNELWQIGEASVHEVRQAALKIHEVARQCKSEIEKSAFRAAGQAVSVGHMKEHAIVCSDYAIKTIQLAFPDQLAKVTKERQWQLNELKKYS